jgi:hypothetical protein
MTSKALLISACLLAPLGALPLPSAAAVNVGVDLVVRVPPPAPRYEAAPPPRVGFVWTPGYWAWRENRHVWVAGVSVRERAGYVYSQPQWVERNGEWHFNGGQWARHDKDHDGIPNRADHDRDGDGVRNRADRHPDVYGR